MLTPVIGNNVCRERIEKETGKRVRKKRTGSTSFLFRVTHLIRVEYVPHEMSRKLKLLEFLGNVPGENARNNSRGIKSLPLLCAPLAYDTITRRNSDIARSLFVTFYQIFEQMRRKFKEDTRNTCMLQSYVNLKTDFIIKFQESWTGMK